MATEQPSPPGKRVHDAGVPERGQDNDEAQAQDSDAATQLDGEAHHEDGAPDQDGGADPTDARRREKARKAKQERKVKRDHYLEQIRQSSQDEDEIHEIMSQNQKNKEGAFCTFLFTLCFIGHFLLELGGYFSASHYSMQSVLSDHFENRYINLPEYAESQAAAQANSSDGSPSAPNLQDLMTIGDIKRVEQLPIFARFVVDQVYPKNRFWSNESSYFSYNIEENLATATCDAGSTSGEQNNTSVEEGGNEPGAVDNTLPEESGEDSGGVQDMQDAEDAGDTEDVGDAQDQNGARRNLQSNSPESGESSSGSSGPSIQSASSTAAADQDTQAQAKRALRRSGTRSYGSGGSGSAYSGAGDSYGYSTDQDPGGPSSAREQQVYDHEMTLINSFNYFCGMKINIREAELVDNDLTYAKGVITRLKQIEFSKDTLLDYADQYVSLGAGTKGDQTYSQYFPGELSRDEALALYDELIATNNGTLFSSNQAQPMINTQFKLAFYNNNEDLGLILTFDFFVSNSGMLYYKKTTGTFKPQNYVFAGESATLIGVKASLLAFWAVQWLVLFIYAIIDLGIKIKNFFVKRQFELDWFKYIEYCLLVLCLVVLLLWQQLFPAGSEYQEAFYLPMDEWAFDTMDDMTRKIDIYKYTSGFIAILLMAKILRSFTAKFPAFGVLFETISAARMDLLYFTIITLVMTWAFTMICYCLFGPNGHLFSSYSKSTFAMLQMLFGRDLYPELDQANPQASIPFFVIYSVLFYFIILNVYAAIVMRTYDNLRQKKQLMTEAMADIFAKQAQEHSNKVKNIMCCRMDRVQVDDSDSSSSDGERKDGEEVYQEEERLSPEENKRRAKIRRRLAKQKAKEEEEGGARSAPSLSARIQSNITTLRDLVTASTNDMTVQAFEQKLNQTKIKIVKRKWHQKEARILKFGGVASKSSFIQLRNSAIFVGFISIVASMLDAQQLASANSELDEVTWVSLHKHLTFTPYKKYKDIDKGEFNLNTLPGFTYENITQVGDIQDFIRQPLYIFLHERDVYNLEMGGNMIIPSGGGDAGTVGRDGEPVDELARIMINIHNEVENKNEQTWAVFENQTQTWSTKGKWHLDMHIPEALGGDGGKNLTRTDSFCHSPSNLQFDYFRNIEGDGFVTAQGHSGYIFSISSDKEKAKTLLDQLYQIDFTQKFMRVAQINIDFVSYNVNYDIFQYVQIQFFIDGAGSIDKAFKVTKSEINHFDTKNENKIEKLKTNVLALEVVFLLFVLFETYKIYRVLKDEWDFLTSMEEPPKHREQDGALMKFLHRCGIEPSSIEGKNCVVVLVNVVRGLCKALFQAVFKIVRMVINILQKSFFNALDMISMVLLIVQIALWGEIIRRGEFAMDPTTRRPINTIEICGGVASYFEQYITISTINIGLLFVRVLQCFTFSKKLSTFSELVSAAAFDIIFFGIMWCVMLVGFAIAFFVVYGSEIESLSTVPSSYGATIKMSFNEFLFDEMVEIDERFTLAIFIVFMFFFKILLSNMFIAIFSAHYFQYQRDAAEDGEQEEAGFVELVLGIIRNKLKSEEKEGQVEDAKAGLPGRESPAGQEDKKSSKKQEKGGFCKCVKQKLIAYVQKIDILDILPDDEDADEKREREEETKYHGRAIQEAAPLPDIFENKTDNYGLKPFVQNINIARQGKGALKQAQENRKELIEQQTGKQKNQFSAIELVNSNIWLRTLEERIQKISKDQLSLYDFQNRETVYSALLEEFAIDDLTVIQKQLLKIPPLKRMDFIKKKMRIYEQAEEKDGKVNRKAGLTYRSQIDYIYLIWKALEFEHLYDSVNVEEKDQILELFEFMNSQIKYKERNEELARMEAEGQIDQEEKEENDQNNSGRKDKRDNRPAEDKDQEEMRRKEKERLIRERKTADNARIKYKFLMESKIMTDKEFNRVTELQHELWTVVLDHYERHCLWFYLFDTLDRVRLWNSLVFSDGYFRLLANSRKYERKDLNKFFKENITSKVLEDERIALGQKRRQASDLEAGFSDRRPGGDSKKEISALTQQEQRVIRDRHFTPEVMLKMWNMIKQRQYEVEVSAQEQKDAKAGSDQPGNKEKKDAKTDEKNDESQNKASKDQEANKQPKRKMTEMTKKDYNDMIRSLFKIMIHGVSHDRLAILMQEALDRGSLSLIKITKIDSSIPNAQERDMEEGEHRIDFEIYKRLVTQTYDPSEYRLPLWLPLSLEQKLDMILHQRIDEEVEMMQFLIDEELGCGQQPRAASLKRYEEVDKMLERALDGLIFEKYMTMTRLQALNASIKVCTGRLKEHDIEDEKLQKYETFLISKHTEGKAFEDKLNAEISQKTRINAMLVKKIGQQMKQKMHEH